MLVSKSVFFICMILLSVQKNLKAQPYQNSTHISGIFYDEDQTLKYLGFSKLNQDRNYTLGLGLYFSSPAMHHCKIYKAIFTPIVFLNRLLKLDSNNSPSALRSLMVANGSFTPAKIQDPLPIYNDRPYGSITYLQMATNYVDNTTGKKTATKLNVGVLGTYVAREAQTFIHNILNIALPEGWKNQISDVWEPTFLFSYTKERLINQSVLNNAATNNLKFELKHGISTDIGYYTGAHYALSFRTGWFDPRDWGYDNTPLGGSNRVQKLTQKQESSRHSEFYFLGSLQPQLSLYNALLNGQFKNSIHTLSWSETQHLLFEFNAGIGVTSRCNHNQNSVSFKIKMSGHSPEFKVPTRPTRWHYWGSVELSCTH